MEWITALRGQTVGLDTAPLIYFIEQHPVYCARLRPFFEAAEQGQFRVITSFVTLLEVLVHPLRNGREDLAREYRDILLHSRALTSVPIGKEIAEEAARLRARHGIRTPDAIQLATARGGGAAWFLTNDASIPAMTGISTIVLARLDEG